MPRRGGRLARLGPGGRHRVRRSGAHGLRGRVRGRAVPLRDASAAGWDGGDEDQRGGRDRRVPPARGRMGDPDGRVRRLDRRPLGRRADARPGAASDRAHARGQPLPRSQDEHVPAHRDGDAPGQLLVRCPLTGREDALRDRARQPARRRRVPGPRLRHPRGAPPPVPDPRPQLERGRDVRFPAEPRDEPGRPLGLHALRGRAPLVRARARHGGSHGRLRRPADGHATRARRGRAPRPRRGRRDARHRVAHGRHGCDRRHEDAHAPARARRHARRPGRAAGAGAGRAALPRRMVDRDASRRRDRARRGRARPAAPAPCTAVSARRAWTCTRSARGSPTRRARPRSARRGRRAGARGSPRPGRRARRRRGRARR